ncbi:MAG: DNA adenine methylase [Elusimicrobia bacterium]|nr:DNA adenine methylase [Elusimicrobiota bacterium]
MEALSLFNDIVVDAPPTEGIKYAGSKLKLLPYILQLVRKVNPRTILDGFSGTTRVSQALAKSGYRVFCNDISLWSETFGVCYLLNQKQKEVYGELIQHLNSLKPVDGWFSEHYGGLSNNGSSNHEDGFKKPWQIHNTRKLDAIRDEIERLVLPRVDKAVALTSLMLALDQVDSTLGHFVSYLKDWSPRSYKNLFLKIPRVFVAEPIHRVYRCDIFDLIQNISVDLAYFDPPYGSNNDKMPPSRVRYASYYHLWTTICAYDRPKLFGKAKRRVDTSDTIAASCFEEFRRNDSGKFIAVEAIERLIRLTNAKWIILSYSSGGRATAHELSETLRASGKVLEVLELDYKRNVMSGMKWTNEWIRDAEEPNHEFLFLIEKK